MSRVLPFTLAFSAALHVGAAVAWYTPQEQTKAMPVLSASLRSPVALSAAEQPIKADTSAPIAKSRLRASQESAVRTVEPAATVPQEKAGLPPESNAASAPMPVPEPAVEPPRYDAAYLANPPPPYPGFARKRGIAGTVMLEALISAAGEARDIRLVASAGDTTLDEAARNAVRTWRFAPARRGKEPVEAWVRIPVVYKLD